VWVKASHQNICDKNQNPISETGGALNGYSRSTEKNSLPGIILVKIWGEVMWAYLDTGSARNFISLDAARMLNLKPKRHEPREIVTLNWITKQSMTIYEIEINTLDGGGTRENRGYRFETSRLYDSQKTS
jgi:hypothetical protein